MYTAVARPFFNSRILQVAGKFRHNSVNQLLAIKACISTAFMQNILFSYEKV